MEAVLLAHFVIPVGHIIEALSVGDVVYDDDAVGVAIVAVGDGSKPLLSGRIPLTYSILTSTSLALSPLTLIVFVFCLETQVRSRRRWC